MLDQVRPRPRDADELHDLLLSLVAARPYPDWAMWYDALVADGRAGLLDGCWVATERREAAAALGSDDDAAAACVAGHLQLAGPVTVEQLVADDALPSGAPMGAPLSVARAHTALARLEARGSAIELPDGRWCARNLLVRLHRASRSRRRGLVEAVPIADFVRFLTHWQHVTPDSRLEGRAGLLAVLEQLQGIEAPAAEWEAQILSARLVDYDPRWLDELCLSGEVAWGRLTPRAERTGRSGAPSPATPLAFVVRDDLETMLRAVRAGSVAPEPEVGAAADVLAALRVRGACFRPELAPLTGRLPAEVDEGLWDLVARGLVTADAFSAVRALLSARDRWRTRTVRRPSGRLARRRAPVGSGIGEGRWSLLPGPEVLGAPVVDDGVLSPGNEALAESVAHQLLLRWGVVAWELWGRESFKVPWREVVWALRRMEARGLALGGRFVAGLSGEQYALPEAVERAAGGAPPWRRGRAGGRGRGRPAQHDGPRSSAGPACRRAATSAWCTATESWWTTSRPGELVSRKRTIDLNADVGEAHRCEWDRRGARAPFAGHHRVHRLWGARGRRRVHGRHASAAALEHSVRIGAHPSYPDRAGFGRQPDGDRPRRAARRAERAAARPRPGRPARPARPSSPSRRTGRSTKKSPRAALSTRPSATPCARRVARAPLWCCPRAAAPWPWCCATAWSPSEEGFCDRAYRPDGGLVDRQAVGAVLADSEEAAAQALSLAKGAVVAVDGSVLTLWVDTLCIHGDSPGAVAMATAVRQAMAGAGIDVVAPARA